MEPTAYLRIIIIFLVNFQKGFSIEDNTLYLSLPSLDPYSIGPFLLFTAKYFTREREHGNRF